MGDVLVTEVLKPPTPGWLPEAEPPDPGAAPLLQPVK
jgi:hypothetical protein